MAANQHWTLDRRVPVAVIFALLAQTFGVIWWAAGITSRVETLELRGAQVSVNDARIQLLERDMPVVRERIQNIDRTTDRIEKKLDKISINMKITSSGNDLTVNLAELKALGEIEVVVS